MYKFLICAKVALVLWCYLQESPVEKPVEGWVRLQKLDGDTWKIISGGEDSLKIGQEAYLLKGKYTYRFVFPTEGKCYKYTKWHDFELKEDTRYIVFQYNKKEELTDF